MNQKWENIPYNDDMGENVGKMTKKELILSCQIGYLMERYNISDNHIAVVSQTCSVLQKSSDWDIQNENAAASLPRYANVLEFNGSQGAYSPKNTWSRPPDCPPGMIPFITIDDKFSILVT